MSQYLYRIDPTRPEMLSEGLSPHEEAAVVAHFAYLQSLMAQGTLIVAGRTQTLDSFGIVIFNADSDQAAQAIMEADPVVVQGVMRATLYPYRVALIAERNVTA